MIFNLVVLIFEILYYSMFMYYARQEGKFSRYVLLFTLITIFFLFAGNNNPISYLLLIIMILYGLKYIVKIKVSLYDMFIIFLMLCFKIAVEGIIYMTLYCFYKNNFLLTMVVTTIKNIIIIINKNKLNLFYIKLNKIWKNNNFYIRYSFIIFMLLFFIFSVIFLLIK